jgi:hypothetical protein
VSISNLPNNGRNFLSFMQLTPGVTIVQGPDGDEISINGQKGINNNISVDGADFNNPFFGEQRGGQRPAFTFNQDAIQEMVVVADGAAGVRRSGAGFVTSTKSGTNTQPAATFFLSRLAVVENSGEKFPSISSSSARRSAGRQRTRVLPFAYDQQEFNQTKQLDPARIEQRVVDFFASLGSPDENGSIDRTNDARVFLGKVDYQLNPANLFTVRYNYTWSRQENGTFDVDSWGRSAKAPSATTRTRVGIAPVDLSTLLNSSAFSSPGTVRGRTGPDVAARRAVPGHRLRLREQLPLRHAVLPAGRVLRHALPDHEQLHAHQGQPHDQGGG